MGLAYKDVLGCMIRYKYIEIHNLSEGKHEFVPTEDRRTMFDHEEGLSEEARAQQLHSGRQEGPRKLRLGVW